MRSLTWIMIVGLAACGGGGGGPDARSPDAAPPDGVWGKKCTWIVIDSFNDLGEIGCVDPRGPSGPIPDGQACTRGADGETTGYDLCVQGDICFAGT